MSLAPIYKFLKEKLKANAYFFMGDIDEQTKIDFRTKKRRNYTIRKY